MNKFVFVCIIFLIFLSCSSNKVTVGGGQQLLNVSEKSAETCYFKNHFEIAEIIVVQTNDTFLISDIKRLIRYKDKIILLSGKTNQIFIINAKGGRIEQCICKLGNGPGESRKILDVAFDESSEQIMIYNDYSKLFFFDMQGKFLYEVKVDGLYEGMVVDNGKVIFHNKLEGYSCYPYMLKIFDIRNRIWESIGGNDKVDFPIRSQGRQLVKSKQVWFTAPLDFSLFLYDDEEIKASYEIDAPGPELNEDLIKKAVADPQTFFGEIMRNNIIYGFNSIQETIDYLIFRSNQRGLFIINKKDNNVYWDKSVEEDTLDMDIANYYYPHDGNDDKIMFVLPSEVYTKRSKLNSGKVSEEKVDSLKIKEDDNPILIFYKQKETVRNNNANKALER